MGIIADKYNEIFNAVPFKDDPIAYPAKEQYRNTGETRLRTYNAIVDIENLIDTKQADLEARLSSSPEDPDGTKIAQIQALKRLKLTILGDITQEFNTLEKIYNYTKNELANRYLKTETYSKSETYNKQEIDNQHSAMIYEMDWKEAVPKYADILTTYPIPENGWTVNTTVGDPTNHTPPAGDTEDGEKPATWRYNGTAWIKIDAGSIPKATTSNDGLLPAEWVTPIMNLPADTLTELNKKANAAITITAGKGLTGGGTLNTNITINVASADDGIIVNEDNIKLNIVDSYGIKSPTRPASARLTGNLKENVGDLTELKTDIKTSLVAALNELKDKGIVNQIICTQMNHGFTFDLVYQDDTDGTWKLSKVPQSASGVAVKINEHTFNLFTQALLEVPVGLVDDEGNPLEMDEYYFTSERIPGKLQRTIPTSGHIQSVAYTQKDKDNKKYIFVNIKQMVSNKFDNTNAHKYGIATLQDITDVKGEITTLENKHDLDISEVNDRISAISGTFNIEEVTQAAHGFTFTPITLNAAGKWENASVNTGGAVAMAVRIDDNKFQLWKNGTMSITTGITDDKGNALVEKEYYYLSQTTPGKLQKADPISGIAQRLIYVRSINGIKTADVFVTQPINLTAKILTADGAHELGIATITDVDKKANKTGDTFTGGVTIETAGPNHFKSTNTVGTVTSTFGTDATSGIIETTGAGYYKQHKRGNHEMNNPLGDFIFGTTKTDGTYPDFTFTNKDSNPLVINGKDLATGKIHYENIGSATETIDILEWAKTAKPGFYRSVNGSNLFDNLPESHSVFELQVGSIKDDNAYKTIVFKSYNKNYFWINTYNPEGLSWLGWSKILNNNDNILLERPTITTKEQADKLFNTMTNIMTGYTYIASFDTVFAGTSGVKPEVQYGFLYTYVYKADTQKAVYQVYIGFAGNGQYNISRRGVVQANGVDIVYSDWKMENQQVQSGGASGRNWLKLADGTLIQYGNISINTSGTNYDTNTLLSFPLAFSNTSAYSVACTVSYPNRADKVFVAVNTPNQGNINIRFNQSIGTISATIFWQAIGRWK